MVAGFGGTLTKLSEEQKKYIDYKDGEAFKEEGYKY